MSLAFGLTYTAAIYSARTVSDAHVNPAVTVAMLTTRRISFARGALYLAAQLTGSVVGATVALVFGDAAAATSSGESDVPADDVVARAPAGCTVPGRHVTESQAFGVEFLASFFLVFVVFACYDKSSMSDAENKVRLKVKEREQPFVIGLTYTGVLLFAVSSQFHYKQLLIIVVSGQRNLAQGRIACAQGRFSRIRQVAPMCTHI